MDIFTVLSLLGGLAMFLYGMEIMGDGLKSSAGNTLKRVLERVTQNVFLGMLTGMLVTAVIQSSTATIVLAVGLISAGILNLRQAASIVMGANIGTTVTAQIIRLMDVDSAGNVLLQLFEPATLASIAMIVGIVLIMFIKRRNLTPMGGLLMGFGLLFMGLINMTAAVKPLASSDVFLRVITQLSDVPILGILTGLVITVIVQSSSATVGMLQALSSTGVMTFNLIYPVIMGINLGTCVTTAIVCSIGSSRDAKRTGIVHIVFNVIGTVFFMAAMTLLSRFGAFPALWGKTVNSGDIANFQTLFNLLTAIVLLPFTDWLVALSRKIIVTLPEEEKEDFSGIGTLDEKLFVSPAVALQQAFHSAGCMSELAEKNMVRAFKQVVDYKIERSEQIAACEDRLDAFTDNAENYLVKLSRLIDAPEDNAQLNLLLQTVSDFERIGDYATNIDRLGARIVQEGVSFSETAKRELAIVQSALCEILHITSEAFVKNDPEIARRVEPLEEVIDDLVALLKDRHVQRLKDGVCTIGGGLVFIEILTNAGRAADQCSSIAVFIIGCADASVLDNHHAYLRELHKGKDEAYALEMARRREEYLVPAELL